MSLVLFSSFENSTTLTALCVASTTAYHHTSNDLYYYTRVLVICFLCHMIYTHVKIMQLQNNVRNLKVWSAILTSRVAFLESEYKAYIEDGSPVYKGPQSLIDKTFKTICT